MKNILQKYSILIVGLILMAGLLIWHKGEVENVGIQHYIRIPDNTSLSSFTVVIDPGHGGFDPGKVGVDGTLEKGRTPGL